MTREQGESQRGCNGVVKMSYPHSGAFGRLGRNFLNGTICLNITIVRYTAYAMTQPATFTPILRILVLLSCVLVACEPPPGITTSECPPKVASACVEAGQLSCYLVGEEPFSTVLAHRTKIGRSLAKVCVVASGPARYTIAVGPLALVNGDLTAAGERCHSATIAYSAGEPITIEGTSDVAAVLAVRFEER